jgi:hypothetical protein
MAISMMVALSEKPDGACFWICWILACTQSSFGFIGKRSRSLVNEVFRRVAWRLQARAEGDLSERARQRAAELADDADLRLRAPRQFWGKLEQAREDAGVQRDRRPGDAQVAKLMQGLRRFRLARVSRWNCPCRLFRCSFPGLFLQFLKPSCKGASVEVLLNHALPAEVSTCHSLFSSFHRSAPDHDTSRLHGDANNSK